MGYLKRQERVKNINLQTFEELIFKQIQILTGFKTPDLTVHEVVQTCLTLLPQISFSLSLIRYSWYQYRYNIYN